MRNQVLTKLFQSIISRMGLIRTGKLYGSVDVYTYMDGDTLLVDITAEDYVKFLNDDYRLVLQFEEASEFTSEITSLFAPWLESRVVEILNGSPVSYEDPRVIILLNGR